MACPKWEPRSSIEWIKPSLGENWPLGLMHKTVLSDAYVHCGNHENITLHDNASFTMIYLISIV